jgi:HAD superfamily hydrolase (TIGR01509 family)
MALDAVIFDIDGTLIDSNGAHVEAWGRAFVHFAYAIPCDRIAVEIGKGGDQLVPSVLGEAAEERHGEALRKAQREEFLGIARSRQLPVFPGVRALLDTLRRRGLRTALATSSNEEHLEGLLQSAGLDLRKCVDLLVTADDAEASKPAPDLVTAAVERLGLSPAQCAMVGDTIYDAEACKGAGVVCLGVLSGGNTASALLAAGARSVWRDAADLLAHLDDVLQRASPGTARLSVDMLERLMREALCAAREALERGEVPIGCLLVRGDGTLVSRAHNEMRHTGVRTAHAEMVAFARANGAIPPGARDVILVSTLEPCVMCTGAAMETAVDTIVYGLEAPADSGSTRVRPPDGPDSQMPRIVGGVLRDESRALFEEWLRVNGNAEQRPYVELLLAGTRAGA